MPRFVDLKTVAWLACAATASCGGGSGSDETSAPTGGTSAPPPASAPAGSTPAGIATAQRIAAATATANSASNACSSVRPFYWEIGDRDAAIASGSVADPASTLTYSAASLMSIASASKWLYAMYVTQRRAGSLTADDVKFLTFRSGYTTFDQCQQGQTVGECDATGSNGAYTAANDGKFYYSGGHMEKHATTIGLSDMDNTALAAEIKSQVGVDLNIRYSQPQLAGGIYTTPSSYALALRRILAGQLQMSTALGTHKVCTNPRTCADAVSAPIPPSESWSYSIGHWVEDDPTVGDGAFSSAGAFGFYPWIDASKQFYGVLARQTEAGAIDSVFCGRIVRKAWSTGVAQ